MKKKRISVEDIENMEKEFLSVEDVCNVLGMNHHTLYRNINDLPFAITKIGRVYKIPRRPFLNYLKTGKKE
ncbi:MAG: helix-turn-helix domain-containing protein [Oscillospiraceae bacterium]|nr:helix-turn-helix domain-containing protein [Oscillospiraceae bacterium]